MGTESPPDARDLALSVIGELARSRKTGAIQREVERVLAGTKTARVIALSNRVREVQALRLGCEAALAHAEGLRMDTPEDQAVVDKLVETLRLALAVAG